MLVDDILDETLILWVGDIDEEVVQCVHHYHHAMCAYMRRANVYVNDTEAGLAAVGNLIVCSDRRGVVYQCLWRCDHGGHMWWGGWHVM